MAQKGSENSYGKILKNTSIFGVVQLFQILVSLVRGKFVAMFLGPAGMGFSSMFTSAMNSIAQLSQLGLNVAYTKETASSRHDSTRLATISHISSLLIRVSATLGALLCLVLSPWLSKISFGTTQYAWQFALLSIAVGLTVAGNGRMALLQGMHATRRLSTTSLAGALTGLVAGVPLYYFFGTAGIVPAMIILATTTFGFYAYGVRKTIPKMQVSFSREQHGPLVRKMLGMGIIMLSAVLFNTLCNYLLNIYIRINGDISHVGLFNAANSITMQYAGVVFMAMAMDYFPRLSAVATDRAKMQTVVNRQMEIVALIATPMALLLVATAPVVIRILLTSQFLPITALMRWLGISILLKAISYPLGYIGLAKDNKKLYFWMEAVTCNVLFIGLALPFYHVFGLMGLGYAAVIENGVCILVYLAANHRVYGYRPNRGATVETLVAIILGAAGFSASILTDGVLSYLLMGVVIAVSAYWSLSRLKSLVRSSE